MVEAQRGSAWRRLAFWLGALMFLGGALLLAYWRMTVGLTRTQGVTVHFTGGELFVFLGTVFFPGLHWGLAVLLLGALVLGLLFGRFARVLLSLLVGGIVLAVSVSALSFWAFSPRFDRVVAKTYIVDAPCLHGDCFYHALVVNLGPEDKEWVVPLALEAANRPVGDNRWCAGA